METKLLPELKTFAVGDRIKPRSGPYKRHEMTVLSVTNDRVQVHCEKLQKNLTFPAKLLRVIRGADIFESPIPPAANGNYVPCDPRKLKVGDRIKQAGDPFELKFKDFEPETATVLASFKLFCGGEKTVRVASGSLLINKKDLPLEKFEDCNTADDETPLSDRDLELIDQAWERHKTAATDPDSIFDQEGFALSIGDRVTAAWQSGRYIYYGEIKSFSSKTKKVHGTWTEGRRKGDGDQFSVAADQLIKCPKNGVWSPGEAARAEYPGGDEEIHAQIEQLESSGLPPPGAWIDVSKVGGANIYLQAKWKSREAIFDSGSNPEAKLKSQYIGKKDSAEHKAAIAMVERRQKIKNLKKQLRSKK